MADSLIVRIVPLYFFTCEDDVFVHLIFKQPLEYCFEGQVEMQLQIAFCDKIISTKEIIDERECRAFFFSVHVISSYSISYITSSLVCMLYLRTVSVYCS
jgi:hypothetical protein